MMDRGNVVVQLFVAQLMSKHNRDRCTSFLPEDSDKIMYL